MQRGTALNNKRAISIKLSFLALVLFGLAPTGASLQDRIHQAEDQKPITVNATLVQVPAFVTDKNGKFVTGLSREEFALSEDGKHQSGIQLRAGARHLEHGGGQAGGNPEYRRDLHTPARPG
jgi:hypothetical protein